MDTGGGGGGGCGGKSGGGGGGGCIGAISIGLVLLALRLFLDLELVVRAEYRDMSSSESDFYL